MKTGFSVALSALAFVFAASSAYAEGDETKIFLAFEGGQQVHRTDKSLVLGGAFGVYFPSPTMGFSIAAFLQRSKMKSYPFGLGNVEVTHESYGGEFAGVFFEMLRGGFRFGNTRIKAKTTLLNPAVSTPVLLEESALFAGPVAGLDFPLADEFAVGPQLSYLFLFTEGSTTRIWQAEGVLKFLF